MKSIVLAGVVAGALGASALDFEFACDRADVIYRLGETSVVRVKVSDGKAPAAAGRVEWRIGNFGDTFFTNGVHDVAKEGSELVLSRKLDRVGFTRFDVREAPDAKNRRPQWKMWGVACEPERIRPGGPCPADFRDFWRSAVAAYDAKVPEGVRTVRLDDRCNAKRDFYRVEIPTVHGRTVYGFYSEPKGVTEATSLPLLVTVPGAGPSSDFTGGDDRAFRLFVNVHYYLPAKPAAKHSPEREALQKAEDAEWNVKFPMKDPRYCRAGIAAGREEYFYYDVILAVSRAVDWAVRRRGVDRSRVLYSGTSQGGGFGLYLCGLNRHFTRATIFVPALTDLLGFRDDRRESGWPRLVESQLDGNKAAAERNAPYFDGVNFARSITFPIRYLVGGADTVCPPMAGLSAFNVTPSSDKAIEIVPGQGHAVGGAKYRAYEEWLMRREPRGTAAE